MTDLTNGRASAPRGSGVQSFERALDILELLSQSDAELGPCVDLASATAHRLLATLTHRGYVRENRETHKYALGLKALTLATSAQEHPGPLARGGRGLHNPSE